MKRLHAHIGSCDATLKQAPEVFDSVCVDSPVHIFLSMVDDLMLVFAVQSLIPAEFIAVKRHASVDVFLYHGLNGTAVAIFHNGSPNFPTTLKESHHGSFVLVQNSSD